MRRFRIALGSLAVAAAVTAGCDTAPPGGGLTNGPAPDMTSEKPGIRTDGPDRDRTDQGEMKGAGALGGTKDSGTGGKGGNSGEAPPAKDMAPTPAPTAKDTTGPNGAAGATKPSGDIKVGTPKSPQ